MMEPVLKLGLSQEVVMEGWLLKRGSGYDAEAQNKSFVKGFSSFEQLIKAGRALTKRYFVLVRTKPYRDPFSKVTIESSAFIDYFSRQPKIERDETNITKTIALAESYSSGALNSSHKSKRVKQNKTLTKKDFKTGRGMNKVLPQLQLIANLRNVNSFNEDSILPNVLNVRKRKGRIELKVEDTKVEIQNGKFIVIQNPGRTYYLRAESNQSNIGGQQSSFQNFATAFPDLKTDDQVISNTQNTAINNNINNKTDASVVAGQWVDAIRTTLRFLSEENLKKLQSSRGSLALYSPSSVGFTRGNFLSRASMSSVKSFTAGTKQNQHTNQVTVRQIPTTFEELLKDKHFRDEFRDHLRFAQAVENIDFYDAVCAFRENAETLLRLEKESISSRDSVKKSSLGDVQHRVKSMALDILAKYIAQSSECPVNISSSQRSKIERLLSKEENKIDETLFLEAEKEIFLLMETNFSQRFYKELVQRTGCFAELFHKYDLYGYDIVVSHHFGSVMNEVFRLKRHYETRLSELNMELDVLSEQLVISTEIAVPSFKTSAKTLKTIYSVNGSKAVMLNELKSELESCCTKVSSMSEVLQNELNRIIESDKKTIQAFKQVEQDKTDINKFFLDIEYCFKLFNSKKLGRDEVEKHLKQFKLTGDNIEETYLKAENDFTMICTKLAKEKKGLSEELTRSLEELEKVDLNRLTSQEKIAKAALAAEYYYVNSMRKLLTDVKENLSAVDVKSDIKSHTAFLYNSLNNKV